MAGLGESEESGKRQYLLRLKIFCAFAKKSPDLLIQERKEDLKSDEPEIMHRAETKLSEYMGHLKENRMSSNTRRSHACAIKSFYGKNYYPLNFSQRMKEHNKYPNNAASREDIRKMLQYAKVRDRALILTMAQSGLAAADICGLKYGDIRKDFEEEKIPCNIHKMRHKTGEEINTFICREAVDAIKLHLNERKLGTKKILPETITDESPLFLSRGLKHNEIRSLTPNNVNAMVIEKVVKKAGLYKGFHSMSSHSLRRFFQTTLEFSGVSYNWIKLLMGHRLRGVESAYSKPSTEQLRTAYSRAMSNLAITSVSELEDLKNKLKQRESEMEELRQYINRLEQKTNMLQLITDRYQTHMVIDALSDEEGKILKKLAEKVKQDVIRDLKPKTKPDHPK